jgi:hypothetical protein
MPPVGSVHRDDHRARREVDDDTSGRRRERARARALLGADFHWSDPASSAGSAGSAERTERAAPELAPAHPLSTPAYARPPVESEHPVASDYAEPVASDYDERDAAAAGRRTIVITGRGSERYVAPRRGYDARVRAHERSGFKPDRVAMWAVLLGLALLLGAATSSHAAVLHAVLHHAAPLIDR